MAALRFTRRNCRCAAARFLSGRACVWLDACATLEELLSAVEKGEPLTPEFDLALHHGTLLGGALAGGEWDVDTLLLAVERHKDRLPERTPCGPAPRRRASAPCRRSSGAGGGRPRATDRGSWQPGSPSPPRPDARRTSPTLRVESRGTKPARMARSISGARLAQLFRTSRSGRRAGCVARCARSTDSAGTCRCAGRCHRGRRASGPPPRPAPGGRAVPLGRKCA